MRGEGVEEGIFWGMSKIHTNAEVALLSRATKAEV